MKTARAGWTRCLTQLQRGIKESLQMLLPPLACLRRHQALEAPPSRVRGVKRPPDRPVARVKELPLQGLQDRSAESRSER